MKNLQELRDRLLAARNPGHEIGTFLLQHSNSPEYLVGHLEAYLEAARRDLFAQRNRFRGPGPGAAPRYRVMVGNVGTVEETGDEAMAREVFAHYEKLSRSDCGRAGRERVCLFQGDDLIQEYNPPYKEENEDG